MILILSQVPLLECPYWEWIPNSAENCILFAAANSIQSHEKTEIESKFKLVRWFSNWPTNALIEKEALDLKKQYELTNIIALSEVDLIRSERILKKTESVLKYRDKIKMRETASEQNIPQPKFSSVSSLESFEKAVRNIGYPLVMKPRLFGGSIGVRILQNTVDSNLFLSKEALISPDIWNSWIAESYQPGKMLHTDGIVKNGNLLYSITSRYFSTCLDALHGNDHGSFPLDANNDLHSKAEDLVKAFISKEKSNCGFVFHAEFFETEGELFFCEIAARPGGGRIRDSIFKTTQWLDLFKTQAELQADIFNSKIIPNKKSDFNNTPIGWFIKMPTNGKLVSQNLNAPPSGIFSVKTKFSINSELLPPKHSGDDIASGLFLKLPDQTAEEAFQTTSKWFSDSISIEVHT